MSIKSLKDVEIFYEEYEKGGGFETWSSSTKLLISRELIGKVLYVQRRLEQNKWD